MAKAGIKQKKKKLIKQYTEMVTDFHVRTLASIKFGIFNIFDQKIDVFEAFAQYFSIGFHSCNSGSTH